MSWASFFDEALRPLLALVELVQLGDQQRGRPATFMTVLRSSSAASARIVIGAKSTTVASNPAARRVAWRSCGGICTPQLPEPSASAWAPSGPAGSHPATTSRRAGGTPGPSRPVTRWMVWRSSPSRSRTTPWSASSRSFGGPSACVGPAGARSTVLTSRRARQLKSGALECVDDLDRAIGGQRQAAEASRSRQRHEGDSQLLGFFGGHGLAEQRPAP